MARVVRHLGILAAAAVAGALTLAGGAVAGDRYGAGGHETQGYDDGYSSSYGSRESRQAQTYSQERFSDVEDVDPCAAQYRMTGRGCGPVRDEGRERGRVYRGAAHERYDNDLEAVDPCAVQQHMTGRNCLPEGRAIPRYSERVYDDAEAVDPCAVQSRLVGRGCETGRYFSDRGEGRVREDVYGDWRAEQGETVVSQGYGYAERAYDRRDEAPVDACAVHACYGEVRDYQAREHFAACCEVREARPVWVTEQLPESFFVSDGGVGGFVDYGGGGGGGGFAVAGGFSDASAFSSSRASASASASVQVSINAHNHMMKHGWGGGSWGGGPWGGSHGGGHGCGCKKGH